MTEPSKATQAFLDSLPAAIADLTDMLAGRGAHADHIQEQHGRCVYCSCGKQAQGRLPKRRL